MNQSTKDRAIYIFSGLMIGLGLAAFLYNFKTIQMAKAANEPQQPIAYAHDSTINNESSIFRDFFNEEPFKEMEEMRDRFFADFSERSLFPHRDSLFSSKNWEGLHSNHGHFKIKKSETPEHLVYEVAIEGGGEGSTIDVNVIDQMVTITGRKVDQSNRNNENQQFYSTSTFSQSFSLPPGLDTENVEMENSGQKVVLRFPKYRSEV